MQLIRKKINETFFARFYYNKQFSLCTQLKSFWKKNVKLFDSILYARLAGQAPLLCSRLSPPQVKAALEGNFLEASQWNPGRCMPQKIINWYTLVVLVQRGM